MQMEEDKDRRLEDLSNLQPKKKEKHEDRPTTPTDPGEGDVDMKTGADYVTPNRRPNPLAQGHGGHEDTPHTVKYSVDNERVTTARGTSRAIRTFPTATASTPTSHHQQRQQRDLFVENLMVFVEDEATYWVFKNLEYTLFGEMYKTANATYMIDCYTQAQLKAGGFSQQEAEKVVRVLCPTPDVVDTHLNGELERYKQWTGKDNPAPETLEEALRAMIVRSHYMKAVSEVRNLLKQIHGEDTNWAWGLDSNGTPPSGINQDVLAAADDVEQYVMKQLDDAEQQLKEADILNSRVH